MGNANSRLIPSNGTTIPLTHGTILSLMLSGGLCVAIGFTLSSLLTHYSNRQSSTLLQTPSDGNSTIPSTPLRSGRQFSDPNFPAATAPPSSLEGIVTPTLKKNNSYVWANGLPLLRVVITGVSAALPGKNLPTISPNVNNIHRIINGELFIEPISDEIKEEMLEKNVIIIKKDSKTGKQTRIKISKPDENISLCAAIDDSFDLSSYGVPISICQTMDRAVQLSVACGLEALKDAGIVTGHGEGMSGWVLPEHLQPTTGIVYATSFPALDTAISEVTKFFRLNSKEQNKQTIPQLIESLRASLLSQLQATTSSSSSTSLPTNIEELLGNLTELIETIHDQQEPTQVQEQEQEQPSSSSSTSLPAVPSCSPSHEGYEFDRKFLFRVLVLGNAQLAQIVKARGPNMQTNAACAGSTQAIAIAHDMIQLGRAERMIVIAGDNASSNTLMPWLGNGFRALGAATICSNVENGSCPFDVRRSGMILGSGGIGMVLESEEGARRRYEMALKYSSNVPSYRAPFKCRLLASLYSNSAYHGASLDKEHIAEEMERFISTIERDHHISRHEIARNGVYFSHETSTNSSPTASCASNELYALRKVFNESFSDLLILNTKGFTGHPMGVSYEDVVAVEVLFTGRVPPIANFQTIDPHLGDDVKLSQGGVYPCRYAMRFAAGFGSQIALALYGAINT